MISLVGIPGGTEQGSARFHDATQSGLLFKTYEFLISGIFQVVSSDSSWLQVSETAESETVVKGNYYTYQ